MALMIGLLSFVYLVKFTEIHTKGYQLRKIELEKDRLINVGETKNTDIAKLRSLNEIRNSDAISRMIPARNAVYIKQDGSVAQLP